MSVFVPRRALAEAIGLTVTALPPDAIPPMYSTSAWTGRNRRKARPTPRRRRLVNPKHAARRTRHARARRRA